MKTEKKKLVLHAEAAYVIMIVLMALSVAMVAAADFGVAMIVAPAYLLSLKVDILSFGQCEYIVQGLLFILFCIIIKKFKPIYLTSFLTALIYGAVLDLWRMVIPGLNPGITAPGSMEMWQRILLYVAGTCITSFSVALCFKSYIYPEVYDVFVKGICERYNLNRAKFKTIFDASCLLVAVIMSLVFFHGFKGIGIGTVITTVVNGTLIGFFGKVIDKFFVVKAAFPKLEEKFKL